jgi:hypothetical protein
LLDALDAELSEERRLVAAQQLHHIDNLSHGCLMIETDGCCLQK